MRWKTVHFLLTYIFVLQNEENLKMVPDLPKDLSEKTVLQWKREIQNEASGKLAFVCKLLPRKPGSLTHLKCFENTR